MCQMMQPFIGTSIFPVSNLGIAYLGWFVHVFAKIFSLTHIFIDSMALLLAFLSHLFSVSPLRTHT